MEYCLGSTSDILEGLFTAFRSDCITESFILLTLHHWLLVTKCSFYTYNLSVEDATELALDRPLWRLLAACSHRDGPALRGWRLPSRTWNQWTSPWMKQLTWLRIVHSGDWCLPVGATHS